MTEPTSTSLRALLIEDEPPARVQLTRMLARASVPVAVVGEAASCAEAEAWLDAHPAPDVIFCDIQLGDGSALGIFEARRAPCPIVFCTAFDRYVLDALEVGGVDYLLKPVKPERLERALEKLRGLSTSSSSGQAAVDALLARLGAGPRGAGRGRARRFVVKRGAQFVTVALDQVAYFTSEHKLTALVERSGATSFVDASLAQLEADLPQGAFFRANRAFLVSLDAVTGFRPHTRGRLSLSLVPAPARPVVVSQENAGAFRGWLEGR